MAWRMVARRCPHLSMTVVGDWAQRSIEWGTSGWAEALGPAASRLRVADLTLNYRTPQEAMELAAAMLATAEPNVEAPTSVRSSGFAPWSMANDATALPEVAAGVAAAELAALGEGRTAVIVSPSWCRRDSRSTRRSPG